MTSSLFPIIVKNLIRDIGVGNYIWIYNWDETSYDEKFFAIPIINQTLSPLIPSSSLPDIISVSVSHFSREYNHLLVITKDVDNFKKRLLSLQTTTNIIPPPGITRLKILRNKTGHLIRSGFTPRDILEKKNQGTPIQIYHPRCKELYDIIQKNPSEFFIEVVGKYTSSVQCYFNLMRSKTNTKLLIASRGLYKIIQPPPETKKNNDDHFFYPEDVLEFISDSVSNYFPPCKVTSFYLSTEKNNNNDDDTMIISRVAFQTVKLQTGLSQHHCSNNDNDNIYDWSIYPPPNNNNSSLENDVISEKEIIEYALNYLRDINNGIIITGWNIHKRDFCLLVKKMKHYNISLPLLPMWKLSVDTLECKEYKYITPPPQLDLPTHNFEIISQTLINKEETMSPLEWVNCINYLNGTILEKLYSNVLQFFQFADKSPSFSHLSRTGLVIAFIRNFFQSVVMAPLDEREKHNKKEKIKGGLVLQPSEVGILRKRNSREYIGCVDFKSLYPNIAITYNIIKGYVACTSETIVSPSLDCLIDDNGKRRYYHQKNKTTTTTMPIRVLCQYLIDRRHREENTNNEMAKILKLMVNSIYGLFGLRNSPLYDPIAASLITAYGRYHLQNLIKFIKDNFNDIEILYGDTDSLFIRSSNGIPISEIVDAYNNNNNAKRGLNNIQLAIEASDITCIILIRKKLYAYYEKNLENFKFSGFPKILMPRLKYTMMNCLKQILQNNNNDGDETIKNILEGEFTNFVTTSSSFSMKDYLIFKKQKNEHHHDTNYFLDGIYIPKFKLIPLIKAYEKKVKHLMCSPHLVDDKFHTIDKGFPFLVYLEPTFKPLLKCLNTSFTINDIVDRCSRNSNFSCILKYIMAGYLIFDFSALSMISPSIKVDFLNDEILLWEGNTINNDDLVLRGTLSHCSRYITLDDTPDSPRFYHYKQLDDFLTPYFINNVGIKKYVRLSVGVPFLHCDDQHNQYPQKIFRFIYFLCFIFNKPLNLTEQEQLQHSGDKMLILLPTIAIKCNKESSSPNLYEFTYY